MEYQALEGLFDALCEKLGSLYNECAALLTLSLEKQGLLVAGDNHDKLRDMAAREEAHAGAVAALEKERMEIAVKLAKICGLKEEPVTISMLAPYAQEDMGAKLLVEASRLNECMLKLKEINSLNRDLLEMKMSYASFMLDVFTQDTQGQSNLYGANGQENQYEMEVISFLDSEI